MGLVIYFAGIKKKWLWVGVSPNIGRYRMSDLPNNKETSAKISVLVTSFVPITLIVANAVKNGLSKLFITFGMSPRKGLYLLKLVFNCEETSAKILVLVTILWIKSLNETKDVKIGPCKFSIELFYVTTNWLIFQKTAPLKFIRLLKWSCLGHNNTKQAKNPECQAGRVDIAVEQCG